ncbi:MAG: HlyD family efflux transporter periplasmic adaptor subunit [Comamonadaceae bacterium]|jgi:HlyD family secretion protein
MNRVAPHQSFQWSWLPLACCLLTLFSACSEQPAQGWSGYAEGDYVYIAAPLSGRLETITVQAGQSVAKGAPLFALDAEAERAASDEAAARLASARAQALNLDKGRRSDEVAVTQAQLAQAQANAAFMQNELARQQQLLAQGFISRSRLDDATTAVVQAQARVAELNAALRVAHLPARTDERVATQASATAASEALRQSKWREGQKQQTAPEDGLVSEVFFRAGEFVAAGQPVLALLPPQNIKARFFVPESDLAKLKPGQAVLLRCDGCDKPIAAHISRIATQAEYTPPVIYSNAQRAKLVFMVEARPDSATPSVLHPGQPLDVRLP